jgi:uncharacterized protein YlzI (FlbEa/FlbD family)
MSPLHAAVLLLITVHGPTGVEIDVNVAQITSIRRPEAIENGHFAKNVKCVLVMTNGKLITTLEECEEVIKKIEAVNK